jgi:hypothetical protein
MQSWTSQVTWDNRSPGTPWQIAGGSGAADRGGAPVASIASVTSGTTYNVSLPAALVQGWVDDSGSNHGLIAIGLEMDDGADFRDCEFATVAERPQLTVVHSGGVTATFRQGVTGYTGCTDNVIAFGPDLSNGNWDRAPLIAAQNAELSRFLLAFDLSSLPTDTDVQQAVIELHSGDPQSAPSNVYAVSRPWTESAATWSMFDGVSAWEAPGASGATDRATTLLGAYAPTALGLNSFALNAAGVQEVQRWVNDPSANHGLLFDYPATTTYGWTYGSETSDSSLRPALRITAIIPNTPGTNDGGTPGTGTDGRLRYLVGCGCTQSVQSILPLVLLWFPATRGKKRR